MAALLAFVDSKIPSGVVESLSGRTVWLKPTRCMSVVLLPDFVKLGHGLRTFVVTMVYLHGLRHTSRAVFSLAVFASPRPVPVAQVSFC